jgi:UPF0755 protein
MDNSILELKKEKSSRSNWMFGIALFVIIIFVGFSYVFRAPIHDGDVIIHVTPSDSLQKISNILGEKEVVRYPYLFKILVTIFSGDKHIPNGDYLFKNNESLLNVSWQVGRGIHGISPIKITLKEGVTNNDMAKVISSKLISFNTEIFLSDERSKEGYLFPDTYFFFPMSTTDEIVSEISTNFKKRISLLNNDIKSSGRNLSDIITMASILEKEAKGKNDGAIISGILWKRIKLGMLLQVDAAPDTYKNVGLPSSPISNPGLSSIGYAIHPEESPYLFYLHDSNGQVHYATTFSEHKSNIARYLK